jgi:hypothetical protein
VHVAADGDWTADRLHIRLLQKDLLGLLAKLAEVALMQTFGLQQIRNALIDVHLFKLSSEIITQLSINLGLEDTARLSK